MTEPQPPWVAPFVLDVPDVPRERHGHWDFYDPRGDGPRPLVVFVHGGPVNPAWPASPREWPVYRGYGAQVASRGFAGVVVDHRLHGADAYPQAYADVLEAVEGARADERVDADRVAVWVFSGGGPMLAPLLRDRPSWLKALGATYPALDSFLEFELPEDFRPLDVEPEGGPIPLVFTRVGRERDFLAPAQPKFLARVAGGPVEAEVIDVPEGVHGFDHTDYTDDSRAAVDLAIGKVLSHLS
ncbi:MAG TPA: alpha/beta hydrolase [Phytomonospora sp.]